MFYVCYIVIVPVAVLRRQDEADNEMSPKYECGHHPDRDTRHSVSSAPLGLAATMIIKELTGPGLACSQLGHGKLSL